MTREDGRLPGSKNRLKENDVVEIDIRKTLDIRELFGKYKFKDVQALKKELRKGWHD